MGHNLLDWDPRIAWTSSRFSRATKSLKRSCDFRLPGIGGRVCPMVTWQAAWVRRSPAHLAPANGGFQEEVLFELGPTDLWHYGLKSLWHSHVWRGDRSEPSAAVAITLPAAATASATPGRRELQKPARLEASTTIFASGVRLTPGQTLTTPTLHFGHAARRQPGGMRECGATVLDDFGSIGKRGAYRFWYPPGPGGFTSSGVHQVHCRGFAKWSGLMPAVAGHSRVVGNA